MGEAPAISSLLVASGLLSLGVWVAVRERWRGVSLHFTALSLLVAEAVDALELDLPEPSEPEV